MSDDELARAAIDDAFARHVGKLFDVLCTTLVTDNSPGPLERFGAGLALARHARVLARDAVS